jgi:hypothetical protein
MATLNEIDNQIKEEFKDTPEDSSLNANTIVTQQEIANTTGQYGALGLKSVSSGVVNNSNEPSYIINARRVIINSQTDPTMIFGEGGVSISSPSQVSVDSDDKVILHGETGVYIGIPNKGEDLPTEVLGAEDTPDFAYEPMVLGSKLVNLMEDLIQVIKNAVVLTPTGDGYFREDTQYDLLALQARLSEITSTYAYIDGYSHPKPEKITAKRPNTLNIPEVTKTGTTTGNVQSIDNPVNPSSQPVSSVVSSLPNYYEEVKITTSVINNKVKID